MSAALAESKVSALGRVHLARLHVLRNECLMRSEGVAKLSPVAHEWARLSREHRILIMLLAGIDEAEDLYAKDWNEFNAHECQAIRVQLRLLRAAMAGLNNLVKL